MKAILLAAVRFAARLFYRRIETSGFERIPAEGAVLFVANHLNGLVDPVLALATLPRPVVFVAKSTLWRIPILKAVLDSFGVVPVVRRVDVERDGETGGASRNDESLGRLASVLASGGCVLIFPEGRSHSDPALSPLRTGAARILLQSGARVTVIPLGFWYVRKEEFRSDVLLAAGEPVSPAARDAPAQDWTEAIRDGLLSVTLNAEDFRRHEVAAAVDAIWGTSVAPGEGLETRRSARQALLEAWRDLEVREPEAVARLARRSRAFARLLARAGLVADELDADLVVPMTRLVARLVFLVLGLPVWAVGVAIFWIPYRLTAVVARRAPVALRERDQVSLVKILAGGLLHLLSLGVATAAASRLGGPVAAAFAALALPLAGLFALRWASEAEEEARQALLLLGLLLGRDRLGHLRRERDALRAECERLAARWRTPADNPPA